MAVETYYALDLPIKEQGGPEHIHQSLKGEALDPANYRFTATDGTRVVYHACGRGPLLVVALSPGWGIGMNYLPNGFRQLVADGRITFVAMQTRGTLPSERPADASRMGSRHMAEDVEALRRLLGVETVVVMGHSNGAAIALAYAELFPRHCAKAVLISAQFIGFKDGGPIFMEGLARREKEPRFEKAAAYFKEHMLPIMAGGIEGAITSDEVLTDRVLAFFDLYYHDPDRFRHVFAESTGPISIQHWTYLAQNKADAVPEADAAGRLGDVTGQTLIMSGREDWICSVQASAAIKDGIGARATHVIFEESGHMPWIEESDKFFKVLLDFLFA
ncbi:AB hydrolase superfamily protein YclE [Escovopsis weberi]|uniref:AB hydrolase superfamily protein YclE n=1 Tax=Escovopsis weberi TaxID=150374 RepID=A0A0M8MQU8_ESCWE|nr:AB hydrolase superfamily protein YclE [Escovopsis weberi]